MLSPMIVNKPMARQAKNLNGVGKLLAGAEEGAQKRLLVAAEEAVVGEREEGLASPEEFIPALVPGILASSKRELFWHYSFRLIL